MFSNVIKNKYGYYELKNKPSKEERENYYNKHYYQESKGTYSKHYSTEQLNWIKYKLDEKYYLINKYFKHNNEHPTFLDVGCGEGFALDYFSKKGWDVQGIDFSKFGCEYHNPTVLDKVIIGDIEHVLNNLIEKQSTYDIINLDTVLEHVEDPYSILYKCQKIATTDSILIVKVPNDFSKTQLQAMEYNHIQKENAFWVAIPDHISYFNKDGLCNLANSCGWNSLHIMGDFPIDFYLFQEDTNYIKHPTVGKRCDKARMELEQLFYETSMEETINLYQALAQMGLGRKIIGYFQKKEN